jgi:hypothetical protein
MFPQAIKKWRELARCRDGGTAVTFAMASAPLLIGAFVALEFASVNNARCDMQEALDAAVLVGARANSGGDSDWERKARDAFKANFDYGQNPTLTLTLDGAIVRGLATQVHRTALGGSLGAGALEMGVRAAAAVGAPAAADGCILVLEPTARGVLMNSNSRIESNCGIHVNSAHTTEAVMVNSNADLLTPDTKIVGKLRTNSGANVDSPAQEDQPVVADPMTGLAEPPLRWRPRGEFDRQQRQHNRFGSRLSWRRQHKFGRTPEALAWHAHFHHAP